ncbi:MAG: flagellar assembly protein FliW [Desulfovibrio sp.]|nr:flagellar assembly protein FliW [Desulfovibrio sp.]
MEQEPRTIEIDTRLGKRTVDTNRIIHFPRGLVGFEEEERFVLLQIKPEAPLLVLQSVKSPQLGLLVTDSRCFLSEYKPHISSAELNLLGLTDLQEAAILVTVSIPQGEPAKATLNLTGPIIVNHLNCLGLQIPQNDMVGPARVNLYDLSEQKNQSPKSAEVTP